LIGVKGEILRCAQDDDVVSVRVNWVFVAFEWKNAGGTPALPKRMANVKSLLHEVGGKDKGGAICRPGVYFGVRGLLVFDGVADFGGGGAGEGGGGGVVVHFGDCGGADFVDDGLDDFAGGWIFDDADWAADVDDVADV
jgi:hypothetical protein